MTTTAPPPTVAPDVKLVGLEELYESKDNPRGDLGDLGELTDSIRSIGVLQPVRVVKNDSGTGYTIVSGHRRCAAARAAGAVEVPVLIEALEESDRVLIQLVENLHRQDLSPLDKAAGFQQLADLGNSQGAIAKLVGVSQGTVSKHLALLKLPEKGRELVASGAITQEQGVALAGLPERQQLQVLDDADPEDAPYWIDDFVDEERVRQETKAEVAKLKAAGVPVIEFGDISTKANVGPVYLNQLYWVRATAHLKEDCRAIGVREDGLSIVELCTTPKNHPQPKSTNERMGRTEPKLTAKQEAEKAERERLAVLLNGANERRRKWLVSMEAPVSNILDSIMVMSMLDVGGYDSGPDIESVADWLGLDGEGMGGDLPAIADSIAAQPTSDKDRLRVVFLLTASTIEYDGFEFTRGAAFRSQFGATDEKAIQIYLERLVTLGYELSWIEQKWAGLPFEEPTAEAESTPAEEETTPAVLPEIYVQLKGKRWTRRCSICGHLPGFNTTEEDAQARGQAHLVEDHELEPAS